MGLFHKLARVLERAPDWVKFPLVIMEVTALVVLFSWLYITRSVDSVEVPDLTGKDVTTVRRILEAHELPYRIIRTNSMQTPEDQVIRQRPMPGARVMENRSIEVYVSKGAQYVTVPDLRGRSLLSAKNELYRRGGGEDQLVGPILTLGSIARVHSSQRRTDRILLQQPRPGQRVVRGTQVDVLISKGPWPRRTVIPDLRNKNLGEAKSLLRESRLNVGNVHYRLASDRPPSAVLDQSPPSGRLVKTGSPVTLTVNLSREQISIPVRYTFLRVNPPITLETGRMRIELTDRRGTRVVFDGPVSPGREIEKMVSIKGPAEVVVYWNGEIYQFRRLSAIQ